MPILPCEIAVKLSSMVHSKRNRTQFDRASVDSGGCGAVIGGGSFYNKGRSYLSERSGDCGERDAI